MFKKVTLIASAAILTVALLIPSVAAAKSPKTEFDVNGAHFNLNIIGKKADWNGTGGEGHTIMIPEDTANFSYVNPMGDTVTGSIKLDIGQDKQADDIYVTDGNAFDGYAELMMPDRKYQMFICSKGKPGGSTDIDAMVYYDGEYNEYLICVGEITVTRSWKDGYDLLWVSPNEDTISSAIGGSTIGSDTWIFDYLEHLAGIEPGDQASEYYWDINNNGNKLIQIRFYPMS